MQFTNVVALTTTVVAAVVSVEAGGFSRTCTGYHIQGNNILRASCANGSGQNVNSAIDLNACIGIGTGPGANLVCRANGNYAAQGCAGCGIATGAFMRCGCPDGVRIADLDACISNTRGLLTCP